MELLIQTSSASSFLAALTLSTPTSASLPPPFPLPPPSFSPKKNVLDPSFSTSDPISLPHPPFLCLPSPPSFDPCTPPPPQSKNEPHSIAAPENSSSSDGPSTSLLGPSVLDHPLRPSPSSPSLASARFLHAWPTSHPPKSEHSEAIDIDTGPSPCAYPVQSSSCPEQNGSHLRQEVEEPPTHVYVLEELVQTERTYVHFLNAFLEVFVPYIEQHKQIKSSDAQLLLRNFPVLALLHRELLKAMEGASLQRVADVFLEFSPRFLVYARYCSPHEEAMQVWGKQSKHTQAVSQLLVPRVTGGVKLNMSDVFMKPIQRITKYPLFLAQLAKSVPNFVQATRAMQDVLHRINHARWVHGCQGKAQVFWKRVRPTPGIPTAALVMASCFEIHHHYSSRQEALVRSLGCFLFANRAMVGVKPRKKEDYHLRYLWRLEAEWWELAELHHLPVDYYGFRLRRGPHTHVFDFLTLSREVHLHWLALLYQTLHLRSPTRCPDQVLTPLPSYHEIQVESFRSPPLTSPLERITNKAATEEDVSSSSSSSSSSSTSSSMLKLVRASTSLGFYRSEPIVRRLRNKKRRSIEPYFSDLISPLPPASSPSLLLPSSSPPSASTSPVSSTPSSPHLRPYSSQVDWLHFIEPSSPVLGGLPASSSSSTSPPPPPPLSPPSSTSSSSSSPVSSLFRPSSAHSTSPSPPCKNEPHPSHLEVKWSWLPFRTKLETIHLVQNLPALVLYT